MRFRRHQLGILQREEQFVDPAEGEAGGGVEMVVDRGCEADGPPCQYVGRNSHDHGFGYDRAFVGNDPHRCTVMVDRPGGRTEPERQTGGSVGDQAAIAARQPPILFGRMIVVGEQIPRRYAVQLGAVERAAQHVEIWSPRMIRCHRIPRAVALRRVVTERLLKLLVRFSCRTLIGRGKAEVPQLILPGRA